MATNEIVDAWRNAARREKGTSQGTFWISFECLQTGAQRGKVREDFCGQIGSKLHTRLMLDMEPIKVGIDVREKIMRGREVCQ